MRIKIIAMVLGALFLYILNVSGQKPEPSKPDKNSLLNQEKDLVDLLTALGGTNERWLSADDVAGGRERTSYFIDSRSIVKQKDEVLFWTYRKPKSLTDAWLKAQGIKDSPDKFRKLLVRYVGNCQKRSLSEIERVHYSTTGVIQRSARKRLLAVVPESLGEVMLETACEMSKSG